MTTDKRLANQTNDRPGDAGLVWLSSNPLAYDGIHNVRASVWWREKLCVATRGPQIATTVCFEMHIEDHGSEALLQDLDTFYDLARNGMVDAIVGALDEGVEPVASLSIMRLPCPFSAQTACVCRTRWDVIDRLNAHWLRSRETLASVLSGRAIKAGTP